MKESTKAILVASLVSCFLVVGIVLFGPNANARSYSGALPANPTWGSDIRVNSTLSTTLATLKNFNLAISPANPNRVLASFDPNTDAGGGSGYASSTDAGNTWRTGNFTSSWGSPLEPIGTTGVGWDAHGVGYYSTFAINSSMTGYFVLTTTDGVTWSSPMPVVIASNSETRDDGHLAVDKRASGPYAGSIYMFWVRQSTKPPYQRGVQMRYSRDGGQTWSDDIQVSDAGNETSYSPSISISPNGDIYVAFEEIDNYTPVVSPHKLYTDRSTDGGQTWGTDHLVAGAPVQTIGAPDKKGHEIVINGSAACTEIRINHQPALAVSQSDPDVIYVAWNDSRWEQNYTDCDPTGKFSDIALSRSTDGGATWNSPTKVNDDNPGVDQWQPALAVGPNNTIGAIWYDRRYDPAGYLYDTAYGQSTDGGLTWSATSRVSDVSSNADNIPDVKGVDDLGAYKSLVFGPDYALPSWIDTRAGQGHGDFYTDHGTIAPVPPTSTVAPPTVTSVSPTPTACTVRFADVPSGSPFYAYVRCLACHGVLGGYSCGGTGEPCNGTNDPYFRPGNNITRGQLSKTVSNAAGYTEPIPASQQTYSDVTFGSTFWLFIERLSSRAVMGGYVCGGAGEPCDTQNRPYFRPGANVTRGQTAKIVANAASLTSVVPPGQQTYSDVSPSSPFWLYVERLSTLNVMGGYPCGSAGEPCDAQNRPYFRPSASITRGQASKIVANTFYPSCNPQRR